MAETHDTIDGLLAEFRGYAAGMPPSYHVTMSWHDFRRMLDRFEAAHKREVREAVTGSNQLRDALDKARRFIDSSPLVYIEDNTGTIARGELCAEIDAALAAPPRNCDRPECATTRAAQDVWRKEDGGKTAYYDWLLAPATEQEGGNDADK